MHRLYWTYRPERITNPYDLWNNISLNWTYTASFFLNNQFADWSKAWLTNVIDNIIPEDKYIWEIAPWIPKLTRFIMCEYNEAYVNSAELARSLKNVWSRFDIDILTVEEMIAWIKTNTSLQEVSPWKFLIYPETTWLNWEIIPAKYLTI